MSPCGDPGDGYMRPPLCVVFLQFLVKSIVISKLKVKKQKLLRHPVPGYFSGFSPCDLAFQEHGGSVHLREGWLLGPMEPTPGTKLLQQARWKVRVTWISGKVALLGTLDLPLGKKPSVHWLIPSARASSFRNIHLVQEILCPLPFNIFLQDQQPLQAHSSQPAKNDQNPDIEEERQHTALDGPDRKRGPGSGLLETEKKGQGLQTPLLSCRLQVFPS